MKLVGFDGSVDVDANVARMSRVLEGGDEEVCPVPFCVATLARAIKWCEYHTVHPVFTFEDAVERDAFEHHFAGQDFDLEFVREVWDVGSEVSPHANEQFYDLVRAANYLDIPGLIHMLDVRIKTCCKNRSPEEMCAVLNLPPPTPQETEQVQREMEMYFPGVARDGRDANGARGAQ